MHICQKELIRDVPGIQIYGKLPIWIESDQELQISKNAPLETNQLHWAPKRYVLSICQDVVYLPYIN